LPAALVEHEARELDTLVGADPLDHLLGAGHLRHAVVADEADRLDAPQPGGREPADELRPRLRRQHLWLVLEPIPRLHVAEEDLHRPSVLPAASGSRAPSRAAAAPRRPSSRRAPDAGPAPRLPRRP